SGLAARLLLAYPPRKPKRWTDNVPSADAILGWQRLLRELLALDYGGDGLPHFLPLDRQARRLWVDFFNFWAQEQSQADGDLAAAFSKLEGYAARIALVCQLAMDSESVEVGPVAMRSGITLARWFAREAERGYAILAESEEQREARALVEYIRGKGGS